MKIIYLSPIFFIFLLEGAFAQTPSDVWKKLSDENDIKTFARDDSGKPAVAFRGEMLIKASVTSVASTLVDLDRLSDWMAETAEIRLIRQVSPFDWLIYDRVPVAFPFKDRDFVILFHIDVDVKKRSVRITEKSVDDASVPVDSRHVRGKLIQTTYEIEPDSNSETTIVKLETEFDPAGNLPLWLVRAFLKDSPRNTLSALRMQTIKGVSPMHPRITQLLK